MVTEAEVAALAEVERRRIMDAPQANNLAEAANGRTSSNPYAMGYMGAANGSKRTSSLWKRNQVTPIPGN